MEIIYNYTEHLVQELGEAKHHLKIWEKINDYHNQIELMEKEIKPIFYYAQSSALQLMVLKTARVFDKENNRYPTKCIESLFNKIKSSEIDKIIIDDSSLRLSLKNLGFLESFSESIEGSDCKEFLLKFIYKCENLFANEFKNDLFEIRCVRDKYVAHNEADVPKKDFDKNVVTRLTNLALNITTVIMSSLFVNTIYLIEEDVEEQSLFVDDVIEFISKRSKS